MQNESLIQELIKKKENAEKALFIEPTFRQFETLETQITKYRDSIEQALILLNQAKEHEEKNQLLFQEKQDVYVQEQSRFNEMKFQLSQAFQWETEIAELKNRIQQLQYSHQEKEAQSADQLRQLKIVQETSVAIQQQRNDVREQLSQFQVTSEQRKK